MDRQKQEMLMQNVELYNRALAAWEKSDMELARKLLREIKELTEVTTLRELLLEAYVERDSKNLISEISVLQHIIEQFEGQTDPLLATAWSLLGAALSELGENTLAADAFRQAASMEQEYPLKLVEYSNALFTMNHQMNIRAMAARRHYRGYRTLLKEIRPMKR